MAFEPLAQLRAAFGGERLPKPFNFLEYALTATPAPPRIAARTRARIQALRDSTDPYRDALGISLSDVPDPKSVERVSIMLGQLLLGVLAEQEFEEIYKTTLGTTELRLEDAREARNDTDYHVYNGQSRHVFRMNIKFHGTLFRNAQEVVGLDPSDCFALATYKIWQGLKKQEKEVSPYLFVVVSCPVSARDVGAAIPEEWIRLGCLVYDSVETENKRSVEEQSVAYLIDHTPGDFAARVADLRAQLSRSTWRVLSARRADLLLREKLFDRVFAVRVKSFNRSYRNAEVDMHFSLNKDMTPLSDFLVDLKKIGLHGMAGKLERGLI